VLKRESHHHRYSCTYDDTRRVVPCVPNVFIILLLRQNILRHIIYSSAGLESWKIYFTQLEHYNKRLKTLRVGALTKVKASTFYDTIM